MPQQLLIESVLEQINIYRDLSLSAWADAIVQDLPDLGERIFLNSDSIKARQAAGMIPLFMPGRAVQRANWPEAFKKLKPVRQTGGILKKVKNSSFSYEYPDIFSQDVAWVSAFEKSYICWTVPSEDQNFDTKGSVIDQRRLILEKHTEHPELYDTTDIHPLEYAVLQVMQTHKLANIRESLGNFEPFGRYGFCRFVSFPLSSGKVFCSYFNTLYSLVVYTWGITDPFSDRYFRLVGRV